MENGTLYYQCRICKVICPNSDAVMSTHEKKHRRRSIGKLDNLPSLLGISPIWTEVQLVTEVNGDIPQEDLQVVEVELVNIQEELTEPDYSALTPVERNDDEDDDSDSDGPPVLSPYSPTPPSPPPKRRKSSRRITPTTKSRALVNDKRLSSSLSPSNRSTTATKSTISDSTTLPRGRGRPKSTPKQDSNLKTEEGKEGIVDFTITDHCRIVLNHPTSNSDPASGSSKKPANSKETVCAICGFIGRTHTDLKDHSRTHTKEKPFKCPACPARFSRTQNMRHHIRFNCDVAKQNGLAEKFRVKASQHVEKSKEKANAPADSSSTTGPTYECPKCVEKFSSLGRLAHHSRVHSVGKDGAVFTCCFCQGDFYSERAATDHMARIHNQQMKSQHQCKYCDKYLATGSSLRRHMYLSHYEEEYGSQVNSTEDNSAAATPKFKKYRKLKKVHSNTEDHTAAVPSSSNAELTKVYVKESKSLPFATPEGSQDAKHGSNLKEIKLSPSSRIINKQKDNTNNGSTLSPEPQIMDTLEDMEWMDTPKIVKVEHVAGPLPLPQNIAQLTSTFEAQNIIHSQPSTVYQNHQEQQFQEEYRKRLEMEEPEMEIRNGNEYFAGLDPLAF